MQSSRVPSPAAPNFARAFRAARVAKGASQESFDTVSSRTYVSLLEREINAPTLPKIDALVRTLGLHPLTVLAMSYVEHPTAAEVQKLMAQVVDEVGSLGLRRFSSDTLPRGIKPQDP